MKKFLLRLSAFLFFGLLHMNAFAQDDLLNLLGEDKPEIERVANVFKSNSVIGSHSMEHVAALLIIKEPGIK